jgi:aldehyde dehydrogenase (NAD+)
MLSLAPTIDAIAAGNAVIVKPSEISPNTADVVATFFKRYLEHD